MQSILDATTGRARVTVRPRDARCLASPASVAVRTLRVLEACTDVVSRCRHEPNRAEQGTPSELPTERNRLCCMRVTTGYRWAPEVSYNVPAFRTKISSGNRMR